MSIIQSQKSNDYKKQKTKIKDLYVHNRLLNCMLGFLIQLYSLAQTLNREGEIKTLKNPKSSQKTKQKLSFQKLSRLMKTSYQNTKDQCHHNPQVARIS